METSKYRMPLWNIKIGSTYESITDIYKKYIASISCEYVANAPGIAQIAIRSYAYAENLFTEGMPVRIYMGWDMNNMAKMIDGVIVSRPDGVTATETSYTLTVQDKHSVSLSKIKRNRTLPVNTKNAIVSYICALSRVPAKIMLDDTTTISDEFMPIQKNETDAEFLFKCAENWNCEIWFDENGLNFVDAETAYDYGDQIKKKNFENQLGPYHLGYRIGLVNNNVAKVQWKKHITKGGESGDPGVEGANENGKAETKEDFDFEYDSVKYTLRPELKKEFNNASGSQRAQLIIKYRTLVEQGGVSGALANKTKYFVPVVHGNNAYKGGSKGSNPKHGKKTGLELSIDLNIGDPFLRPPRNAVLQCGSTEESNSYLPSFMFKGNTTKQTYVIDKVKTQLSNGMIMTNMVATI